MVDVDRTPCQPATQIFGQHLHVARQHHQLGTRLLHELHQLVLLRRLGRLADRQVVERQAVDLGEEAKIRVVRNHTDDVDLQLADAPAVQQVPQAMVELGHHDQHLRPLGQRVHRPVHLEARSHRLELFAQSRRDALLVRPRTEDCAHEKAVADVVVEAGKLVDVTTVAVQETRNCRHLPRFARARHRKHPALIFIHDPVSSLCGRVTLRQRPDGHLPASDNSKRKRDRRALRRASASWGTAPACASADAPGGLSPSLHARRAGQFAIEMPAPTRPSAANTGGDKFSPRISPPASTPITGARKEKVDRRVAG